MVVATSSLITSACWMRCKHIICLFSLRNASFAQCRRAKKLPIRTGSVAADHAHLKKRAGEARLRNFNSPWSSVPGNPASIVPVRSASSIAKRGAKHSPKNAANPRAPVSH